MINSDLRFGPPPLKDYPDQKAIDFNNALVAISINENVAGKDYVVTMPNMDRYAIPVSHIVSDRFRYYFNKEYDKWVTDKEQWKIEYQDLIDEHTNLTAFDIEDWARNNMNWEDVVSEARLILEKEPPSFQDGWVNGEVEIVVKER